MRATSKSSAYSTCQLAADYQELINKLDESMADYLGVLERAFSPDVEVAQAHQVTMSRIAKACDMDSASRNGGEGHDLELALILSTVAPRG